MADAQKYQNKLRGTRVLIVGGTSGIGFSVAEACVEHGAYVTVASSSETKVSATISTLTTSYPSAKDRIAGHVASFNDAATAEDNAISLLSKVGHIDHLIWTAGDAFSPQTSPDGKSGIHAVSIANMTEKAMVRHLAPQVFIKHAVKQMDASFKSSITLTTGTISEKPIPGMGPSAFGATGLHGLTRGLALDLAPIRVNCVSPGGVLTPLWDTLPAERRKGMLQYIENLTCTGRIGQPEDVAEAYVYLLKDRNATGSVLRTDGGGMLK